MGGFPTWDQLCNNCLEMLDFGISWASAVRMGFKNHMFFQGTISQLSAGMQWRVIELFLLITVFVICLELLD